MGDPYPSDCYDSWENTDLDQALMIDRRPRYSAAVSWEGGGLENKELAIENAFSRHASASAFSTRS